MDEDQSAARFVAVADRIVERAPVPIDMIGASLIAGIHLNVGSDSRSLANKLGLAHALVLREITTLSDRFLTVTKRDSRTQRSFLLLTPEGEALAQAAAGLVLEPSLSREAI